MPTPLEFDHLIATMTVERKASLMSGLDAWQSTPHPDLGIPAVWFSDGPHGVRREVDHLVSLPATCFPTESALGATWDRELVGRVGAALGREASAQGVVVLLGPGINMKRTPLCGRNFEYFSEDPSHTGELGVAYVNGVQSAGVGVSVKHFAANNQENERHWISAEVDERTLREVYCAAFERVVTRAKPWTVMCSYNRVNGVHASENRWLLTDLLRSEWGFEGVVISDWWAVHDRVAALVAGLDIEMPGSDGVTDREITEAITGGDLDLEVLDRAVRRVLGLCGKALAAPASVPLLPAEVEQHHVLAREAASRGIVLLRNEKGTLPLNAVTLTSIAVIGRFAAEPRIQGGGSADVNPTRVDTALDAFRAVAPDVLLRYEPGFVTHEDMGDDLQLRAAVEAASAAQVAIVCVGLTDAAESEGYDRRNLDLPANQRRVLTAIAETGTPMVVVLTSGSAVCLDGWHDSSAAIVVTWLAGQAGGGALVDVLFGIVNPSGKLAETFPLRLKDTPAYANYPGERGVVRYGEGVLTGYRWYDALDLPVRYPFGFGLSYTTFEFADLRIDDVDGETAIVHLSLTVTNTGEREGAEVIQIYVGDSHSAVRRPVRELKAFHKVTVAAGKRTRVEFELTNRDFAYYDVVAAAWRREGGAFRIEVGASSRDIRLTTVVDLPDDARIPALIADVELANIVRRSSVAERE